MGKKAKKVTIKDAKKGGQSMAQEAEKKRVEQEDELQKQQQDQVDPGEVDDETSQGEDDDQDQDEGEKTTLIQRIKIGALKVLKILIKWVIKPLAIAIVVFASAISLIVNLGGPSSDQQDENREEPTTDPDNEAPEEEFEDDSDSDGEDQAE